MELRKGEDAYKKTGKPIDSTRGQGNAGATRWLKAHHVRPTTITVTWSYGEWASIAVCQLWCHRMQYHYDKALGRPTDSRTDACGDYEEPQIAKDLEDSLEPDSPIWERVIEIR